MKRNDVALIFVVIIISAVLSIVMSNMLFASKKSQQQQVEVVDVIAPDFPKPDSRYFNTSSIDPTQPIKIQDNNNTNPFNATAQ